MGKFGEWMITLQIGLTWITSGWAIGLGAALVSQGNMRGVPIMFVGCIAWWLAAKVFPK